jgi:hypothetical protein
MSILNNIEFDELSFAHFKNFDAASEVQKEIVAFHNAFLKHMDELEEEE